MNRLRLIALAAVIVAGTAGASRAQFSYLNEDALSRLADNQSAPLDSVPVASYRYYVVPESNRNWARQGLYRRVGHTDDSGRKELIQLLNRNFPPIESLSKGDTLILPLDFEMDLRAYTPLPRRYEGAAGIDKLFVIDKTLQVFGAYEYGALVRWGIVSTGDTETRTPSGRFNFNWRAKDRVSSLSPPGEEWRMFWVMNFHHERGIHVHQYPLPVGGPVSHGCVRTTEADAKWLFNWADTWRWKDEKLVSQGSTVIVIGEEPTRPRPFAFSDEGPRLIPVELPDDPMAVPPGTDQQKRFDRRRPSVASTN
ncbi:MAG TPA: L,D-transpeptidase [Rhodothermales bacterium]|nr:L,D-transpeptidase [Rhodothermales bacterium]